MDEIPMMPRKASREFVLVADEKGYETTATVTFEGEAKAICVEVVRTKWGETEAEARMRFRPGELGGVARALLRLEGNLAAMEQAAAGAESSAAEEPQRERRRCAAPACTRLAYWATGECLVHRPPPAPGEASA
jgi:hypothetical protein